MQLKFKIEMLLSETRAFPGELKMVICGKYTNLNKITKI